MRDFNHEFWRWPQAISVIMAVLITIIALIAVLLFVGYEHQRERQLDAEWVAQGHLGYRKETECILGF